MIVDVVVHLTAIVRPNRTRAATRFLFCASWLPPQGETLDEVRANLREAAEGWLAVAHLAGKSDACDPVTRTYRLSETNGCRGSDIACLGNESKTVWWYRTNFDRRATCRFLLPSVPGGPMEYPGQPARISC